MILLTKHGFSIGVLCLCIVVAVCSTLLFGRPNEYGEKDAAQYSAYASHLSAGLGYTDGSAAFTAWREPGYPLFLGLVYSLFGNENYFAVALLQALLVGCAGYIIFCLFDESQARRIGVAAGLLVSFIPSYGYYANETMTEMLSVFLYALITYLALRILRAKHIPWGSLLLLGLVCGFATLTRVQFLFFLPGMLICYGVYKYWQKMGWKDIATRVLVPLVIFVLMLGGWALYVQAHTGNFELVSPNREQESIHYRAVRAQLSYGELDSYLIAWVRRQSTPGYPGFPILDAYDFKGIRPGYLIEASTTQAAAAIEHQDIHNILTHPGEYLYGNAIEIIKLVFVEEIGVPTYLRVGEYVVLYALFVFGFVQLFRRGKEEFKQIGCIALLFILYNCAVICFFDAIPRYNTPFLSFYLIVGFVGIALWWYRDRLSFK